MQPIDGASGHIFGHSLNAIVERPAIMAVQIAFPLGKKISDDRMKITRQHPRLNVGKTPAPQAAHDERPAPVSLAIRSEWFLDEVSPQQLRVLRKYRVGQSLTFARRRKGNLLIGF